MQSADAPASPRTLPVLRRRPVGQWVTAAIAVCLGAFVLTALLRSPNIDWQAVRHYFTSRMILRGVTVTVTLTVASMIIGVVMGGIIAVMRLSENRVLRSLSWLYAWFFRGIPLLVQLIFWYNLAIIFPRLSLGVPYTGLDVATWNTNRVISVTVAALLGLGLAEGAIMSEIIRGGMLAVDTGQTEAALSIGMTRLQLLRRVVLPQSMRVIVPPTGNEFILMLKTTSLVSVISGAELLSRAQDIYAQTYQVIELLIVASIWYLVLTTLFSIVQYHIERRVGRGYAPVAPDRGSRWRAPNLWPGRPPP